MCPHTCVCALSQGCKPKNVFSQIPSHSVFWEYFTFCSPNAHIEDSKGTTETQCVQIFKTEENNPFSNVLIFMFGIVNSLSCCPSNQETPVRLAFAKHELNHLLNKQDELNYLYPSPLPNVISLEGQNSILKQMPILSSSSDTHLVATVGCLNMNFFTGHNPKAIPLWPRDKIPLRGNTKQTDRRWVGVRKTLQYSYMKEG